MARAADSEEFERFSGAVTVVPPGLAYLNRHPLKRKNIRNWFPGAESVLICAFRYWEPGMGYGAESARAGEPAAFLKQTGRKAKQQELLTVPGAKISRYALSRDYHLMVKEKLSAALDGIRKEFPGAEGKIFCDTSPVMEKELARLAGLGFRGKNTLIISREMGSYFFLGGIALDFKSEPDAPIVDSCGGCDSCVKACPTGALKDGALDASLCLSYWTTQSKEKIPPSLASKTGGYAYGCDLCQEACPANNANKRMPRIC